MLHVQQFYWRIVRGMATPYSILYVKKRPQWNVDAVDRRPEGGKDCLG